MKQDRAEGWLPATWHGRRGLWRLFLLVLIVAGIGRVACARAPSEGGTSASGTSRSVTEEARAIGPAYRDAERSAFAPRSIAATTRSTPRAKAAPSFS